MKIESLGNIYSEKYDSDIAEFSFSESGLRVVINSYRHEDLEPILIEYHFNVARGFRFLDEGDLLRYWAQEIFTPGYHLFEIINGGWKDQEVEAGQMNVTDAAGDFREWFLCSKHGCVNVISVNPPLIREFT